MKLIAKVILLIWLILWVNFIMRDLFRRGYIYDYNILIKRDAEGRRAYTCGDRLYEFLKFAKNNISPKASYKFVGLEVLSHDYRRGVYYLYPCLEKKTSDYILVYDKKGYEEDGFHLYAALDEERFILEKRR